MKLTRAHRTLGIAVGLATLAMANTATASSPNDARIAVRASGTITDEGWRHTLHGTATGRPFRGELYGVLRPQTGTWPAPGSCQSGDASVVVDGPSRNQLVLIAVGDVCRLSDDSAYVFVGQFDSDGSTPRRLDDIQGTVEIRVTDDGQVLVTATEY